MYAVSSVYPDEEETGNTHAIQFKKDVNRHWKIKIVKRGKNMSEKSFTGPQLVQHSSITSERQCKVDGSELLMSCFLQGRARLILGRCALTYTASSFQGASLQKV